VLGFESSSYYINHRDRIIENATLSEEECVKKVSSNIEIETCRLALVPIGNESETLCYEFSGNYDGAIYYAYIDAKTGRQVQLFKVVEGTEGSLLM
jgi:germination protein YpeB